MKLAGVCAALVAGSAVYAQQAPAVETAASSGLLGKRYVEAGFAATDVNHTKRDVFGTGVAVNLPVASSLDVGFAYNYAWAEGNSDLNASTLAASVTEFVDVTGVSGLKAFGTLALGYEWLDTPWGDDEETFWGADLGVEYSFNSKLSATASVGYTDNFHGPSDDGVWNGTVTANYWLTEKLAANAALSLVEGGDVVYGVGVALKF